MGAGTGTGTGAGAGAGAGEGEGEGTELAGEEAKTRAETEVEIEGGAGAESSGSWSSSGSGVEEGLPNEGKIQVMENANTIPTHDGSLVAEKCRCGCVPDILSLFEMAALRAKHRAAKQASGEAQKI